MNSTPGIDILPWAIGQGGLAILVIALFFRWLYTPAYVQLLMRELEKRDKEIEKRDLIIDRQNKALLDRTDFDRRHTELQQQSIELLRELTRSQRSQA